MLKIEDKIIQYITSCEEDCKDKFKEIEDIEFANQLKVLNAFNENHVQSRHFIGSNGYGHNDIGKEKLCQVFSTIFHAEDAFVTPLISCGTEAISQSLLGILRPNDSMICISGTPYDTLKSVIHGVEGKDIGSLKDYNISYNEIDLINNDFNIPAILDYLRSNNPKIIYIQRSRGYTIRNAINIAQIKRVVEAIRSVNKTAYIVVDNCYGEFTERLEPTDVGADLCVGSLLKNMGGGIAPTGGYIVGKRELVELVTYRCMSPALSSDNGSYEPGYKLLFEGLFVSPHVVAQAKKLVVLASRALSRMGYETTPKVSDTIADIVCCINFKDKAKLLNFTRAIQYSSAVDSDSMLEPGEMDGYEDNIIMASGSFNQGSSIELSCDGPMREPYAAFLQGCLSYAHGKIGLMNAIQTIWDKD